MASFGILPSGPGGPPITGIIGNSPAMQEVYRVTPRVAGSNASVLILGETGVGKELIANAIHQLSHRSGGPFVRVNCGALSESLLESELFGHVRGAFTGAVANRTGRFEAAHGGTVFLDEINSTSLTLQVKLLRVLQEKEFERVGDTSTLSTDARIVAASNRDLMQAVREERFREDLYWRLNVVPIEIPPLRRRREDIPSLVSFFLEHYNEVNDRYVVHIGRGTMEALQDYHWPGNVRELQNYIERAVVMAETDELTLDLLPQCVTHPEVPTAASAPTGDFDSLTRDVVMRGLSDAGAVSGQIHAVIVEQIEKELITQVLAACGGVQTKAATKLGINRNTLHKKIKDYGLDGTANGIRIDANTYPGKDLDATSCCPQAGLPLNFIAAVTDNLVYVRRPSADSSNSSKGSLEMAIQLGDIASLVDGRLIGDAGLVCHGANPLGDAAADQVTMLDDSSRVESIVDSGALAVITSRELDLGGRPQIVVSDPHQAFAKLVAHFRPPIDQAMPATGIDPTANVGDSAVVHPSAVVGAGVKIGERTRIMPGVVIMPRSEIGDDCVLHANVTLYEYTKVADRVVIHASTVIGANGFGYRQEAGRHIPTAQLGYVSVESDVEIGASVTIDRGTYGATRIGEGTKIDNQVMIGHNCQIGRHNLLCSQVGIAGSCRTGDYVILAGQVGLKDHITLGDHAIVGAQAGVMDDCPGNEVYLGSPATTQRDQMQIMAVERRLPEMRRELKKLRRELEQWKQNSAAQLAEQNSGVQSSGVQSSGGSNSNQDQRAA